MSDDKWPEFTMGCDPEFILMYKGKYIRALDVVAHKDDKIGFDHGGLVAEMRPDFAWTPWGLVNSIQSLIVRECNTNGHLALCNWYAGASKAVMIQKNELDPAHADYADTDELIELRLDVGGHIHFGIRIDFWKRAQISKALDMFLATIFMLLEVEAEGRLRKRDYGLMGDIRPQTHGVEYRTLSSWLHTPSLAYGTFCLAKHIVNQAIIDPDFYHNFKHSPKKYFGCSYEELKEAHQSHDKKFIRSHIHKVWDEIYKWEFEHPLKNGVNILRNYVDEGTVFSGKEIKKNWGIELFM